EGCEDVFHRSLSCKLDRGGGEAETLGAQPYLRDRFLARDIDGALPGARERGCGLDQQGRFADAGVAADEQHRATDEAAAGDTVEFSDAGGQARGLVCLASERFEGERPALSRRPSGTGEARLGGRVLLGDRVPFTAGIALALPAAVDSTAVLADEGEAALGHRRLSEKTRRDKRIQLETIIRTNAPAQHPRISPHVLCCHVLRCHVLCCLFLFRPR